jgi:sucrose phosphorylase
MVSFLPSDCIVFNLDLGARVVRLDAYVYLWKKTKTTCVDNPENHEILSLLRDIVESSGYRLAIMV